MSLPILIGILVLLYFALGAPMALLCIWLRYFFGFRYEPDISASSYLRSWEWDERIICVIAWPLFVFATLLAITPRWWRGIGR